MTTDSTPMDALEDRVAALEAALLQLADEMGWAQTWKGTTPPELTEKLRSIVRPVSEAS